MHIARKKTSIMEDIRRKNKPNIKIKQKLSFTMLDLIASYIISSNKSIRNKGYMNIQKLMDILDMNLYQDEPDKIRIEFINAALEARLKYKLTKKEQVIDYIYSSNAQIPKIELNLQEISNDEVDYINESITRLLNTAEFEYQIHEFEGMSKEYDNANPYHKKEIVEDWKNLVGAVHNNIRMNKIEKANDEIFCISKGFQEYARETHNALSDPSHFLHTGIYGLNALLGGGFENSRTYCFFGLQGEGKSTTLLDLALQIKRYNRNYKPKDPTKIPAVVYLTLENSKRETFERFFVQVADAENQYTDYDVDTAIDMMINQGGCVVSDSNPIDIIIKEENSDSVDTSYLYELYDDLADQGFEVICFIVDYLKLINSIKNFSASEERLKLGSVVKEMKAVAKDLDIPIITASQFNREANAKIDEARNSNKVNNIKLLNRANIGESMLILDNIDVNIMLDPEYVKEQCGTVKYMGFKLSKSRNKPLLKKIDGNRSIYQPYTRYDGIKLVEDIGGKPAYKVNLLDEVELNTEPKTVVDDKTPVPDNSNRCTETIIPAEYKPIKEKDNNEEKVENEKKVYLDENGKELAYNPNWRNEPEYKFVKGVGEVFNVDSLPPEQQIRRRKNAKEALDNFNNPKPIELPGPSRYSDEYTFLYDPYGSKEERLAYDYNLMYDKNYTPNEFWMLEDHLNRVKRGLIKEDDLRMRPFQHIDKKVVKNPFIKVNAVDRRVLLEHSPEHELINSILN